MISRRWLALWVGAFAVPFAIGLLVAWTGRAHQWIAEVLIPEGYGGWYDVAAALATVLVAAAAVITTIAGVVDKENPLHYWKALLGRTRT